MQTPTPDRSLFRRLRCAKTPGRRALLPALLSAALCLHAPAQAAHASNPLPDAPQVQPQDAVTARNTPRNILHDQAAIWTSPARLRLHDLEWLAPLTLAAGAAIASDHRSMTDVVSHDPSFNSASVNASNAMIGGFIAAPVALYGFGHFRADDHAREAGILSAEALIDGIGVEQGMKLIFWRERPHAENSAGKFWQSSVGPDSSFPSSHTVFAWSTAAVIAGEYPSRWNQFTVYTLATGVSLTRVLGQEHFPTDVLVGSTVGWLAGHYIYKARHRWHPRNDSSH